MTSNDKTKTASTKTASKSKTRMKATTKAESLNFEVSLAELSQLVEQLEAGDLSLEDSLRQFERGVELTKNCQQALASAEKKVQILLGSNNESDGELTDFEPMAAED